MGRAYCGVVLCYLLVAQYGLADIRVGFFNIQIFGQKKMENANVRQALVKILSRYDIVGIQEIRDSQGTAILALLADLNEHNATDRSPYRLVQSERLGRTSNKEQYAFLYRKDKVFVRSSYQDMDLGDVYEREPYSVRFLSPYSDLEDFVIMIIHTSPSAAETEIDALTRSYEVASNQSNISTKNFLIGGDFNADCNYVTASEWPDVSLRHDVRFTWLIPDDADTTVSSTNCAYDRIVTSGDMKNYVVQDTAVVFDYETSLELSKEEALAVSDHYPVECILKGPNAVDGASSKISVSKAFQFDFPILSDQYAREIYRNEDPLINLGYRVVVYKVGYAINMVVATLKNVTDVKEELVKLTSVQKNLFPGDIRLRMLDQLDDYVTDMGESISPEGRTLDLSCRFETPYRCSIIVTTLTQDI